MLDSAPKNVSDSYPGAGQTRYTAPYKLRLQPYQVVCFACTILKSLKVHGEGLEGWFLLHRALQPSYAFQVIRQLSMAQASSRLPGT